MEFSEPKSKDIYTSESCLTTENRKVTVVYFENYLCQC